MDWCFTQHTYTNVPCDVKIMKNENLNVCLIDNGHLGMDALHFPQFTAVRLRFSQATCASALRRRLESLMDAAEGAVQTGKRIEGELWGV